MDIIDLWELLSCVDDWSFETFPWDVFSLCRTTGQQEPTTAPSPQKPNEEPSLLTDSETSTTSNPPVPQGDVPSQLVSPAKHSENNSSCSGPDSTQEAQPAPSPDGTEEPGDEQSIEASHPFETLDESILSLQLSCEDGSALASFEKLSKRRTNASMEVAKLPENTPKNRYKDVLPYDDYRVPMKESPTGDYINASFVKMDIPPLEMTNEYIATQGPLPHTCDDFWQMVWEQKCSIIVMVTTLKERNRTKCHKYWPDLYETVIYADIQISCFSESVTQAAITRDLLLVNEKKNEDRHVIQIQHVAWPDHGVPDDATDFLEFVQQLREWRKVIGGKVVVHCSAGVGRTGVLILVETVMDFIECGYPVRPLEIVKKMRDQRVMMVQTVGQYKFICEAILKLYHDHQSKFVVTESED